MNELACSWNELRRRGKEFVDLAPTTHQFEELDGLWKGFVLGYLNLEGATESERYQSVLLLQILARKMFEQELRLEREQLLTST